jgi:hypothetical protein
VLFLGDEHSLEQMAAAVVVAAATQLDAAVEADNGVPLHRQIGLQLLGDGLADADLAQPLHVRHALEVQGRPRRPP